MLKRIALLSTLAVLSFTSITAAAPPSQTLANGISVVKDPVQMAPYVSMTILIKASAADETIESAGWRQILASAMMRATANGGIVLEGQQLTKAAEAVGGQLTAQVLDDAIAFTATGDSSTQKELAKLLVNVVLHPRLSEDDFAAARRSMLQNLNAADRNDVPNHSRATEALQGLLYRDANSKGPIAYGLPPGGTVDSLTALTDEIMHKLYKKYFSSPSMVISFSGDADADGLEQIFSEISTGSPVAKAQLSYTKLTPSPSETILIDTPVPWMLLGYRIDSHANGIDRDLAALRVLTAALTETAPSLLSQKLLDPQSRSTEAIANQVSGQLFIRRDGSELMLAVQSDAANQGASKAALLQVINDLKAKPLSDKQLQAAITYAKGDWASMRDSSIIRAVLAGYAKVQGIFPDSEWPTQLQAVTAADVQNVAKKFLNQYAEVTVNPIVN